MTIKKRAAAIVDEAGVAGGIDEVRRIAELGWPDSSALDDDSPELRAAIKAAAKESIGDRPDFTDAALANIDETSANWAEDLGALRGGKHSAESLLAHCLEGAEDDRVQGWRDYVAALIAAV
jgi:hypothetical protein